MSARRVRLAELRCLRALGDLELDEAAELARLVGAEPVEHDDYEVAAAALHLALAPRPEPLPVALRARLERAALDTLGTTPQ